MTHTLTDEQMERLAEDMGWDFEREYASYFNPLDDWAAPVAFFVLKPSEGWELASNGAFQVMVKFDLQFLGWDNHGHYCVRKHDKHSYAENPHTAIALAALEQLESENG